MEGGRIFALPEMWRCTLFSLPSLESPDLILNLTFPTSVHLQQLWARMAECLLFMAHPAVSLISSADRCFKVTVCTFCFASLHDISELFRARGTFGSEPGITVSFLGNYR